MNRLFFPVLLVLTLPGILQAQASRSEEQPIFPYPVEVKTLENGLTVVLVTLESGGLASYWSIVRTGARDEHELGRTGFAQLLERMLFCGTETFPSDVYEKKVTSIGANRNAFTSDDVTAYFLNTAAEDLELVMELESDRFRNLDCPEEMFRTEAEAVYREFRKTRTIPLLVAYEALRKEAFTHHPYGHLAIGYEEDIAQMPQLFDYSRTFFERHYRPENVVLLIVGDIEPAATFERVRRYYKSWKPGYVPPKIEPEPEQTEDRRVEVTYPGRTQPILYIAYKAGAFDPTDPNMVAARLLMELNFGETSAIYKQLMLEERRVGLLEGFFPLRRDPGLLIINSLVKDVADLDHVQAEIDRVIAEARENPPSAQRLEALKSRLRYDFLMDLDTPEEVAYSLYRYLAITGDIGSVDALYRAIEAVTPEDVQNAAKAYLRPERRTIAVLRGSN